MIVIITVFVFIKFWWVNKIMQEILYEAKLCSEGESGGWEDTEVRDLTVPVAIKWCIGKVGRQ